GLPGCRYRGRAGVDAEATAGEERRMAWHGERRPAQCCDEVRRGRRVGTGGGARILRVGLGYDQQESDETDQGGAPHPLKRLGVPNIMTRPTVRTISRYLLRQ